MSESTPSIESIVVNMIVDHKPIPKEILSQIPNKEYKTQDGNTLVHVCIVYYNISALLSLIKLDFSLNLTNKENETPLYLSAKLGYSPITAILVKNGAKPPKVGSQNHPLKIAVIRGDATTVRLLLDSKISPEKLHFDFPLIKEKLGLESASSQENLMSIACFFGYPVIVRMFLEFPKLNQVGTDPFYCTFYSGSVDVFNLLVRSPYFDISDQQKAFTLLTVALQMKTILLFHIIPYIIKDGNTCLYDSPNFDQKKVSGFVEKYSKGRDRGKEIVNKELKKLLEVFFDQKIPIASPEETIKRNPKQKCIWTSVDYYENEDDESSSLTSNTTSRRRRNNDANNVSSELPTDSDEESSS